jgi:hypothetical protein
VKQTLDIFTNEDYYQDMFTPINGNPRKFFKNHKERGPKKFKYGYKDIAEMLNVSIRRVHQMVDEKLFVPSDFQSLMNFADKYIKRQIKKQLELKL